MGGLIKETAVGLGGITEKLGDSIATIFMGASNGTKNVVESISPIIDSVGNLLIDKILPLIGFGLSIINTIMVITTLKIISNNPLNNKRQEVDRFYL